MKIAIIGLGYVGRPELMRTADHGVSHKVSKYGTDPFTECQAGKPAVAP